MLTCAITMTHTMEGKKAAGCKEFAWHIFGSNPPVPYANATNFCYQINKPDTTNPYIKPQAGSGTVRTSFPLVFFFLYSFLFSPFSFLFFSFFLSFLFHFRFRPCLSSLGKISPSVQYMLTTVRKIRRDGLGLKVSGIFLTGDTAGLGLGISITTSQVRLDAMRSDLQYARMLLGTFLSFPRRRVGHPHESVASCHCRRVC